MLYTKDIKERLISMDLELLKRFYMIAEEGGLIKASRKLHVVPSALTGSISDFEYQLKTNLFIRTPKGMKLTPKESAFTFLLNNF